MELGQFHNGLRLLRSIDAHELGEPQWWDRFRDDPYRFFIAADDQQAQTIWDAMKRRGA